MAYIEQSLSANEKIEAIFGLHWTAWLPVWLWVLLAIPTIGITLLIALYVYLRLKYQEQGVTNKRVILKKGIIGRQTEEMKLKSIETVEIDQGVFGRMLGFGSDPRKIPPNTSAHFLHIDHVGPSDPPPHEVRDEANIGMSFREWLTWD